MSLTLAELDRLAKDTGCELHNDCLTCSHPYCKYDIDKAALARQERALKIQELYPAKSVKELTQMFGVSQRTIRRALRRNG